METVLQVQAPHFTAGVVAIDGKIAVAAPILKYMIGWDGKRFRDYCRSKSWTFEVASLPNPKR